MVKCHKGTPEQIKAAQAFFNRFETTSDDLNNISWISDQENVDEKGEREPSEDWELDSIKADKRCPPTPQSELVSYFIAVFLEFLLESWSGKPCYKNKVEDFPKATYSNDWHDYPNSLSETFNYINDLYKRRATAISKETISQLKNDINLTKSEISELEERKSFLENGKVWLGLSDIFKPPPDENVYFVFLNGVWYKGRVSRKLMEGQGIYFWADGSLYEGDFVDGCVTGKGRFEFPDLSVYEGDLYKGFRHGEGMHCLYDSPVMYSGQWWLGKKHGEGLIVYNEPSSGPNFYMGKWENGLKEGFGYRQYPSGAKYIGFWSKGKRHGKGVMLWSNNDIYQGQWNEGLMHGYGQYTWNSYMNKTLSYPATNMYRGYWANGKRFGNGVFETINEGIIETIWNNNMKEGPGAVTCANSTVVVSEYLFQKDKPALFNNEDDTIGLSIKNRINDKRETREELLEFLEKMKTAKAISIPIHFSVADINFKWLIYKYYLKKKEELIEKTREYYVLLPKTDEKVKLCFSDEPNNDFFQNDLTLLSDCIDEEEKYLKRYIIGQICKLRSIYDFYSTLPCERVPPYKCVLLRLFLWQLLIDCKIPNSNFSLVDFDEMIAQENYLRFEKTHDPFERIYFAKFIYILVILSWHLYGQYVFDKNSIKQNEKIIDFLKKYQESEPKLVLMSAFNYFLESDIFSKSIEANFTQDCEPKKKFFESDLMPLKSLFKLYSQIDGPLSAKDFFSIFSSKSNYLFNHLDESKNHYQPTLDKDEFDEVSIYAPSTFSFSEGANVNRSTAEMLHNLTIYKKLSPKKIMRCLSQACPAIVDDGYIVNIDYKLSFLEFYSAICLCTELYLKINKMKEIKGTIIEKHKKNLEEYQIQINKMKAEKMKVVSVSSKKSKRLEISKQVK